jgi:uncharacterized protein with PQ loop repeat
MSPVNILYSNQINPSMTVSYPPPLPVIQQLSLLFLIHSAYTDTVYLSIIHYHFLSLSFLPQSHQTVSLLQTCYINIYMYIHDHVCISKFVWLFNTSLLSSCELPVGRTGSVLFVIVHLIQELTCIQLTNTFDIYYCAV